jgi:hypothetical protein
MIARIDKKQRKIHFKTWLVTEIVGLAHYLNGTTSADGLGSWPGYPGHSGHPQLALLPVLLPLVHHPRQNCSQQVLLLPQG